MSTILYGNIASTRTQRVLLTLKEIGIEYRFENLDFVKGDHHAPKYVEEHHPFAKVPAFEDGDNKLFESRAICRYLVTKYPSELNLPVNDYKALGLFEQAASVEHEYFEPAVARLGFELIFKRALGLGETDVKVVEEDKSRLSQVLDYYDTVLSRREYLGGETYSLVDLFHTPWIEFILHAIQLPNEINCRKNMKRWWDVVSERPATKAVLRK